MIYIGADHRGFKLKEKVKQFLEKNKIKFKDLGALKYDENDDYPDFAYKVASKISKNPEKNKGILICGSGVGVCITANKLKNVRCALAINKEQIKIAKMHDNINCLAISSDFTNYKKVKGIIDIFLKTKFSRKQKYIRRIKKIKKIEDGKFN